MQRIDAAYIEWYGITIIQYHGQTKSMINRLLSFDV